MTLERRKMPLGWYRAAAEQGDIHAQYEIGLIHDEGRGVPQDHAKAIRWYRAGR